MTVSARVRPFKPVVTHTQLKPGQKTNRAVFFKSHRHRDTFSPCIERIKSGCFRLAHVDPFKLV